MTQQTHIEWADSTLNLQMGCDGCELWNSKVKTCYAGNMTRMYEGRAGWPVKFETPVVFPARLDAALKWPTLDRISRKQIGKGWLDGYPRLIFLNDMGDTFTKSLPLDWLNPFMSRMENSPHIWMILTKRADRMKRFFDTLGYVPRNFWLGVSVTSHATLRRLDVLRTTGDDNTIRWSSVEPVLSSLLPRLNLERINGVFVGGESGQGARSNKTKWIEEIFYKSREQGCAFFLKQWGINSNNPDPNDPTMKSRGGMSKGGAQLFGREWREMPTLRGLSQPDLFTVTT